MIIKSEEISNPDFGKYPGSRNTEEILKCGVIVVDKPSGPTSHQVASWVKEILGSNKVGHSGTLDPKVTGVLVIVTDKATKIIPALMGMDKEYIAVMHLHEDADKDEIKRVAEKFTGKIKQMPPKKSAVRRKRRTREIYELRVLEKKGLDVLLDIKCEKGTYVRKLIHDMGKKLGKGAHMRELRRIAVGPYEEDSSVTLHELKDFYVSWRENGKNEIRKHVNPVEFGIEKLKKIVVRDSAVNALCNGAPLGMGGVCRLDENIRKKERVAIMTLKGELVALGVAVMDSEEMKKQNKGICAQIDSVIMEKDLYPRMWKNSK